jgi:chitin synthase
LNEKGSEFASAAGSLRSIEKPESAFPRGSAYGNSGYSGDYSSGYSAADSVSQYNTVNNRNSYMSAHPPANYRDSYLSIGSGLGNRRSWMSNSDSNIAVLPSDSDILGEVKRVLATADLMTVTKKKVREELGRVFGCDLGSKKEYIHRCIDGVLKGEI